ARWPYLAGALAVLAVVTTIVVVANRGDATTNIGIDNSRTTNIITNPLAGTARTRTSRVSNAEACKLFASSRSWDAVESCAKQLAVNDPKAANPLLALAAREAPNAVVYQEFSTALQKQGIDAARTVAARLTADSIYQQDVTFWIGTV